MTIKKSKIVYKNKDIYPAFPSIIDINENYLLSFRYAPKEKNNYSHLHSLSKVKVLELDTYFNVKRNFDLAPHDEAAKQDTGFFRISKNKILAYYFRYTFHPACEKYLFEKMNTTFIHDESKDIIASLDGVGLCMSEDNGRTFSNHTLMNIDGAKHFAIRGSMCFVNGKIFAAIYAYKNKNKYQCYIVESEDGLNWKKKTLLCQTIEHNNKKIEYVEPSLCYIEDKNILVAFIRTHVIGKTTEISTSIACSYDAGATFTKPIFTGISGYPVAPIILDDKLVFIYGYRNAPYGIRMSSIDYSKLEKINSKNNISDIITNEIIIEEKMANGDCGYPWAIHNKDNIVCAYYGSFNDENRVIKAIKLAF